MRGDVRDALRQADAQQLRRLGKAIGNDALNGKIAGNDKLRDALLALVQERLQAIQLAQQAELKALRNRGEWYRRLLRGEKGLKLPEPTRWAAPAQLYKKAAEAICAGELGRGADLLRRASESDRATFKSLPAQVELPAAQRQGAEANPAVAEVQEGEGCNPTSAPGLLALADRVASLGQTADLVGPLRPMAQHRWWTPEEGEEEEKQEQREGGKSSRLAEPSARRSTAEADRDAFLRRRPRK